jgi:hypothetical protein
MPRWNNPNCGFQKGYTPWNKGKSSWNKGIKGIMVAWNKGKKLPPLSEEQKMKLREASLKKRLP